MPAHAIRDRLSSEGCCNESCAIAKIQTFFRQLGKSLWETEIAGLIETLEALQTAYLGKGGNSNLSSEYAFTLCRMIGLKLPYRHAKRTGKKKQMGMDKKCSDT